MAIIATNKPGAAPPAAPATMSTQARVVAAARAAAMAAQRRILGNYKLGAYKSWDDIDLPLPAKSTKPPFTYANLLTELDRYVIMCANNTAPIDKGAVIEKPREHVAITLQSGVSLRPRQQKCVDYLAAGFASDVDGVLTPLEPGEGKSFIAAAEIIRWQQNNYFDHPITRTPFPHVIFLTKASVVIKTMRTLKRLGVRDVGTKVHVIAHTSIGAGFFKGFFREFDEILYDAKIKSQQWILPPPALVIVDECQDFKYIKSKKSLYLEGVIRAGKKHGTKFLFTSATPFVTLNDTYLFCLSSGVKYNDAPLSRENFPAFIRAIAYPGLPSEPSQANTERFNKAMDKYICRPPRDPRKVKAYNSIMLVDFPDERSRRFYLDAEERYQEARARCGEAAADNTMAQFTIFRAAEEWCKAPVFAKLIYDSWKAGKAPICGVSYQQTLRRIVLELLDLGVPRDLIALIWGGTREIQESEVYTGMEYARMLTRKVNGETLPPEVLRKMRKTNEFLKQRYKLDLSKEEQLAMNERLRLLALHGQTLEQRQNEIDAFQEGRKQIAIFTLSAGGTGVDLDHQLPHVRPREGFFTICYYAEEFLQALGRGMRIATLTDIQQHMVFFKNSIAAQHVAPRLLKKIAAVGKITLGSDDLVAAFEQAVTKRAPAEPVPVDITQPVADESDIDDSVLDDEED